MTKCMRTRVNNGSRASNEHTHTHTVLCSVFYWINIFVICIFLSNSRKQVVVVMPIIAIISSGWLLRSSFTSNSGLDIPIGQSIKQQIRGQLLILITCDIGLGCLHFAEPKGCELELTNTVLSQWLLFPPQ